MGTFFVCSFDELSFIMQKEDDQWMMLEVILCADENHKTYMEKRNQIAKKVKSERVGKTLNIQVI